MNVSMYQLDKYYSLPEGIRDLCPELLDDKDIMFAVQQIEVYSKHLKDLVENKLEGYDED